SRPDDEQDDRGGGGEGERGEFGPARSTRDGRNPDARKREQNGPPRQDAQRRRLFCKEVVAVAVAHFFRLQQPQRLATEEPGEGRRMRADLVERLRRVK